MESLTTLTGKYGDEGDQLLFKVLNNGDFLAKADNQKLDARDSQGLVSSISKRGLLHPQYKVTRRWVQNVLELEQDTTNAWVEWDSMPVYDAGFVRDHKGLVQG